MGGTILLPTPITSTECVLSVDFMHLLGHDFLKVAMFESHLKSLLNMPYFVCIQNYINCQKQEVFMKKIFLVFIAISLMACSSQSVAQTKSEPLKYVFTEENLFDTEDAFAKIDACKDINTLKDSLKQVIEHDNSIRTVLNSTTNIISIHKDMLDNNNKLFDKFLTIEQEHSKYSEVLYQYQDLSKKMQDAVDMFK